MHRCPVVTQFAEDTVRPVERQSHTRGIGLVAPLNASYKRLVDAYLIAGEHRFFAGSDRCNGEYYPPGSSEFGRIVGFDPIPKVVRVLPFFQVFGVCHFLHQRLRHTPALEVQLEAQPDDTIRVVIRIVPVDEPAESAQVDLVATQLGLVYIDVTVAQDLVRVAERLEDRALAGAVAAEEQGDGPQVDADGCSDALEVFNFDGGDHRLLRSGFRPAGRGDCVLSRGGHIFGAVVGATASSSWAVVLFRRVRLRLVSHQSIH